jgi:dihydrofolate reductase
MKLTMTTFVSLDGVAQAPGRPEEDPSDGFTRGGWSAPYADEDFGRIVTERFGRVDAFLLGRRTYDIFASYWPKQTDPDDPIASKLNALPKYVASTTLQDPQWDNTTVLSGDVVAQVAELKQQPGNELQVHGSIGLAQTLIQNDLVDVYHLWVFPVLVSGGGRKLFGDALDAKGYRMTDTQVSSTGVIAATYEPTGPATFGTIGE